MNDRRFGLSVGALGFVGLIAAFWQTAQKIEYLKNPDQVLSCNISPVVECGTVLDSDLSAVLGVPNSMIGIVVFAVLLAGGAAMALGMKPTLGFKRLLVVLSVIMFAFTMWFFAVSLYSIGKICIFCVFIWGATIPLAVLVNGRFGMSVYPKSKFVKWKLDWFEQKPWQPVVVMYALLLILFLYRFRDYYFNQ